MLEQVVGAGGKDMRRQCGGGGRVLPTWGGAGGALRCGELLPQESSPLTESAVSSVPIKTYLSRPVCSYKLRWVTARRGV